MSDTDIFKKLDDIRKLLKEKSNRDKESSCFFSYCESKAIASHSLSKSRVLEHLEGKNEHDNIVVYYLDDCIEIDYKSQQLSTFHNSNRKLLARGKTSTSIFHGFCGQHDNNVFEELDNKLYKDSDDINFLHSLRAYAFYLTKKNEAFLFHKEKVLPLLETLPNQLIDLHSQFPQIETILEAIPDDDNISWDGIKSLKNYIKELSNSNPVVDRDKLESDMYSIIGSLFDSKEYPMLGSKFKSEFRRILLFSKGINIDEKLISNVDYITNLSMDVDDKIKTRLSNIHKSESFSELSYQTYSIPIIVEITGSFVFKSNDGGLMSLTFFPEIETGRMQFIISALNNNQEQNVLFSQINIMTSNEFTLFISKLILSWGTNIYISPRYWHNLKKEIQQMLITPKEKRDFNSPFDFFV